MKKIFLLFSLLAVLVLLVACAPVKTEDTKVAVEVEEESAPMNTNPQVYDVVIENGEFMPTNLEVKVGDQVTWTNKDDVEHTMTFESGDVDEKLPSGATYTHKFTEKGNFGYFCSVHPGMQGRIIVN
jgi:plastocyanin